MTKPQQRASRKESPSLSLQAASEDSESFAEDCDLDGVNPVLLSAMVAAIREHPAAEGVEDNAMVGICVKAIRQGTIGDANWLARQLIAARDGEPGVEEDVLTTLEEDLAPPALEATIPEAVAPDTQAAAQENSRRAIEKIEVAAVNVVTTREELDPILEQHSKWIAATLDPRVLVPCSGRANLTGSQLPGIDLHDVDLRGATLKKVDLSGANLEGANLSTANLVGANLANANLTAANLKRCALAGADLRGAIFDGASLRLEDLKGAMYDEPSISAARILP